MQYKYGKSIYYIHIFFFFSANEAVHTPNNALSLNDELIELRKRVKAQDKEIRRLKEENEFLEESSAFFAASRRKSAKKKINVYCNQN